MYAEPGKGAIHGAKDLRHGDVYLRLGLKSLPCPKPETPGCAALAEAWKQSNRTPLLPLQQAEDCVVRQIIDEAAAQVLGVEPDVVADWRREVGDGADHHQRARCGITWRREELKELIAANGSRERLRKDAPEPRRVESPAMGKVRAIPKVGGLHHNYTRRAA